MKKFFIVLLSSFLFFSCNAHKNEIVLHDEDSKSLDPTILWAVVIEPYATFRKEASWGSTVTDHSRFGDILMIEGCKILNSSNEAQAKEIWYKFEKGWISENSLKIYQNKFRAQKAAKELSK